MHNYKSLSAFKLKEFLELTKEEFTIGEALYSIFRNAPKPKDICNSWLRYLTDEDFYKAVETAVKTEQYEQSEENYA